MLSQSDKIVVDNWEDIKARNSQTPALMFYDGDEMALYKKYRRLIGCNYSLSPLTANSLFQVSKHNPLGIRILVQSARG
ncbi:MAG: hypothetical protein J7K15_08220 [Deltaproteobacteria bacterium]|nr:hypothetical protein [Deltaproteobacteria bacterium]